MALPLPVTNKITIDSSKSTVNRIIKAQFGDGYAQTIQDGLNSNIDFWNIIYAPLTGTDLTTVENFITTVGVHTFFEWTPFGEVTLKKWRIVKDSIQVDFISTTDKRISFTIEQVFDLG